MGIHKWLYKSIKQLVEEQENVSESREFARDKDESLKKMAMGAT